jgi:hypothetical protein
MISTLQECIASGARGRALFAVGGVNGFSNEFFDTSIHFLEPLEHLHANMSNLVAHVLHIMKCQQLELPPGVTVPTLTDEVIPSTLPTPPHYVARCSLQGLHEGRICASSILQQFWC